MVLAVHPTELERITHFRNQFLKENSIQFIHDKCHRYGWADSYVFTADGVDVGYGSVWGKDDRDERDTIFECYVDQPFRFMANSFFKELIFVSKAKFLESQSNDMFTSPVFMEFATAIYSEAILFEDHHATAFDTLAVTLRADQAQRPDERKFLLVHNGKVVATGGFLMNYNFPYADIYYDVPELHRRKGFGSLLVQELKKEVYALNRVPAARCNVTNIASRRTLIKSGFRICGELMGGSVA